MKTNWGRKKKMSADLREILVADAIRRAYHRGQNPDAAFQPLPWSVLKESEQEQWLRTAKVWIPMFERARENLGYGPEAF